MDLNSERSKKIIHLIWSFGYGGIQVLVADLLNEQVHDHQVHLIIINQNPSKVLLEKLDKRVKVHRLERKKSSFTLLKYLWLNVIVHSIRPNVVHCHIPDQARLLLFITRRKLHLTLHDVNKELKDIQLYGKVYSISRSVQTDLRNRAGIESTVIYNGIALEEIRVKEWTKRELFRVVVLGRLMHEKKGQDILIRAMAHLVHTRGVKNLHATIIGAGDSRDFLESLVRDLTVSDQVSFAGAQERPYIQEHLRDFDLLVQPSRYEGFGITVIEAMAAGIPVLVSDVDGPMEIILEGKYGHYFRSDDEMDCALKILQIKQEIHDAEYRAGLEKARIYVNQTFSIRNTSASYCESYFSL